MKRDQLNYAYLALQKIFNTGTTPRAMKEFVKLDNVIAPIFNNEVSREYLLMSQHGGIISNSGDVRFTDMYARDKFKDDLAAMNSEDVAVDITPVRIRMDDLEDIKLTRNEYQALVDGLVIFEE